MPLQLQEHTSPKQEMESDKAVPQQKSTQPVSIGRIVHYTFEGLLYAALVTEVYLDKDGKQVVNLSIFKNSHGPNMFHIGIKYGTDNNEWGWPAKVQ